jgi:hypothetical protein
MHENSRTRRVIWGAVLSSLACGALGLFGPLLLWWLLHVPLTGEHGFRTVPITEFPDWRKPAIMWSWGLAGALVGGIVGGLLSFLEHASHERDLRRALGEGEDEGADFR